MTFYINEIKIYYFSDDNDDLFFSEAFANNPTKLLSIAFSIICLFFTTPILYLIVLFEKVT